MIQMICDGIILIGAVVAAIIGITNGIGKPIKFFSKRKREEFHKNFTEEWEKVTPKFEGEHEAMDKKIDLALEHFETVKDNLQEIKEINLRQTECIENMDKSTKDMIRQRIMTIFHTYRYDHAFPFHVKEELDELFKDYKAQHGNNYIDKYYERMKNWRVIYDDQDVPPSQK